jgi:hypothetical protein
MKGMVFALSDDPKVLRRRRRKTRSCLAPTIIFAATMMAIISKTWVTPPVGRGRAAVNINKRIAT